jgi:uncharacterized protein YbaP (TraB family)
MSKLRRLLALVACLALPGLGPSLAMARPALWVVRDADSEIVLFGSVHVLPAGLDWRPPGLVAALGRADDLWFEIPFDPVAQGRFGALAQARGILPPGQALSNRLSKAGRERLQRVCAAYAIPMDEIERMRPWLAEVRLSLAVLGKDDANTGDGVEQRIAAEAPPGARREAFETPEQQVAMFADAPEAEQVASLEDSLKEVQGDPRAYRKLVAAWMSGDPRQVQKVAVTPLQRSSPIMYRRLVTERNAAWVRALAKRMAGSGRTVVVVGAGHLAGPDGVPARLRALGFQVEGP